MCICCVTSCCRYSSMKTISTALLVLTSISLFFSIIILVIPAANTGRYDRAKNYLQAIENNEVPLVDERDLRNLYDYYTRLPNGDKFKLTSDTISFTSLFKKWKEVELVINILGLIIILPLFVTNILIFCIKRDKNGDITDQKLLKRFTNFSLCDLILLIILIVYSVIVSFLRAMVYITDEDIGLYNMSKGNSFQTRIAYADSLNTIQLILFSVSISLTYKLYYNGKHFKGKNTNQTYNNNVIAVGAMNPVMPVAIVNGQYVYGQNGVPYIVVQDPQNMNFNNNNNYNNINNNNNNIRTNNRSNRESNRNNIEISEFSEK